MNITLRSKAVSRLAPCRDFSLGRPRRLISLLFSQIEAAADPIPSNPDSEGSDASSLESGDDSDGDDEGAVGEAKQ